MADPIRLDALGTLVASAARAAGIGVIVIIPDEPPRTVFANDVVSCWVGESTEAILRRPLFDYVAPEDRARIQTTFRLRATDPSVPVSLECTVHGAGGERIPVSVGVARGEADGRIVQIVMLTDLRDRKAAAAKLSASERRFRDLVQAAPDGVVISQQMQIRFANSAADGMLGVGPGQLVGRSMADFLPPDELLRMRERLEAMAGGEALIPAIYRATRPDGREVLAEIASIFTEYDGAPAVLAMARDVTQREALQTNLERTERLAALGRLAAGMAHEINNPLAFVSLSAEALERRLRALVDEPAKREEIGVLLDNISRGTTRVAAIVRDLKAFSRDGDTELGPTDLGQVLASAIRMVQHEITPRAALVHEAEAMPLVVGTARRLEQVFVNLLMNAVQALPEGALGHIGIRSEVEPNAVTVRITDDGVGIPRANLDRVFDPFFTTKPVGVGTGLGLSICHGIVTAAGGSIRAESEEGRGTTICVRLPRALRPKPPETRGVARASAPATSRARILIVEDQHPLARTLAKALGARYEVTLAHSATEAVGALAEQGGSLDAVLCDMLMPDGTGIDVFNAAERSAPALADRFVFMTGGAFLPSLAEFLERMPNPRIEKPFTLPAIEELLDRVVAGAGGAPDVVKA